MLTPIYDSPIAPSLQTLLDVFASDLPAVKFPDVDLPVLEEAAARVKESAEAVARAEAALETARQALQESQEALLLKGQRALAYARVFAEEKPELATKLESIGLPRAARKGPRPEPQALPETAMPVEPRRRGRPPKAKDSATLFAESAPAEAPEPQVAAG